MPYNRLLCFLILLFFFGCRFIPEEDTQFLEYEENTIKSWAYFSQGLQHEEIQNWKEAAVCFEKAAALSPHSARVYVHLAWNLIHLNIKGEALKTLEFAEKYAQPEDYLIYFDIGNVYRAAREYTSAQRCYQKSLEIFPQFQKALAHLEQGPQKE